VVLCGANGCCCALRGSTVKGGGGWQEEKEGEGEGEGEPTRYWWQMDV